MASCVVFDGTESSFTCAEIQRIAPPHPKKHYYSDRFPLRSGSLVNSKGNLSSTKSGHLENTQGDNIHQRGHSRNSYRSKNTECEDAFRRMDVDTNDDHYVRGKQRLNTLSEETGTSRRHDHDPSLDDTRVKTKQKHFFNDENLMRGKPRLSSGRDETPAQTRRREMEIINDENVIRGKPRLNPGREEFSRSRRRDAEITNDEHVRGKQRFYGDREEIVSNRRRDTDGNDEHRSRGRQRINPYREENIPTRRRDIQVNNDGVRGKQRFSIDRDEILTRRREGENKNDDTHMRGRQRLDSERGDDVPARRKLVELQRRRNYASNDLGKRDSSGGDNEDDNLHEDRVKPPMLPPTVQNYDYQAEILRLQRKMAKLQGKVTHLQKRVTYLQAK